MTAADSGNTAQSNALCPPFTEALGMAAQQLVRELDVARMPPSLSDLAPASQPGGNDEDRRGHP